MAVLPQLTGGLGFRVGGLLRKLLSSCEPKAPDILFGDMGPETPSTKPLGLARSSLRSTVVRNNIDQTKNTHSCLYEQTLYLLWNSAEIIILSDFGGCNE